MSPAFRMREFKVGALRLVVRPPHARSNRLPTADRLLPARGLRHLRLRPAGHLRTRRLFGLMNRLARFGPGLRRVPVLFQDALAFDMGHGMAAARPRTFVINVGAVRGQFAAAAAIRTATWSARGPGTEGAPPTGIGPLTIAVAMKRGEDALEGSEAARTLRAGPLAIALVARIAAIGWIADPFVDVDFTTTFATR